jgi:hypothetical protein
LHERGANPFRTAAYRKAALSLRRVKQPLAEILDHDGSRGLRQLPGVGESLSKKIAEIIRDGRSKSLERLRRKRTVEDLLTTLPSAARGWLVGFKENCRSKVWKSCWRRRTMDDCGALPAWDASGSRRFAKAWLPD